ALATRWPRRRTSRSWALCPTADTSNTRCRWEDTAPAWSTRSSSKPTGQSACPRSQALVWMSIGSGWTRGRWSGFDRPEAVKVIVIGAGVVGVTTAHYLARPGHQITALEKESEATPLASAATAGV